MTVRTYQISIDDAALAAAKTGLASLTALATAIAAATLVPVTPPTTAKESASGTTVIGTTGVIVDANANTWGINTAAQVALNGIGLTATNSVAQLAYVNHVLWQKNTAGNWYSASAVTSSGATWTQGSSPLSTGTTTSPPTTPAGNNWNGVVLDGNGMGTTRFPIGNNWNLDTTTTMGTAADGKSALLVTSSNQGDAWIPFSTQITDGTVPGNGIGVNLTGFTKLTMDIVPGTAGMAVNAKFFGTGASKYIGSGGGDVELGGEEVSSPVTLPQGVATTITFTLAGGGWGTSVVGYPWLYKFIVIQRGNGGTYGLRNVKFS